MKTIIEMFKYLHNYGQFTIKTKNDYIYYFNITVDGDIVVSRKINDCDVDVEILDREEAYMIICSFIYDCMRYIEPNDFKISCDTSDSMVINDNSVKAINRMYFYISSIFRTDSDYVEMIKKSGGDYNSFINSQKYEKYVEPEELLQFGKIISLIREESAKFLLALDTSEEVVETPKKNNSGSKKKKKNNVEVSALDYLSGIVTFENLTTKEFYSNPAIGYDNLVDELEIGILTPYKSVLFIGEPGVGKTSLVESLAYRIQNKKSSKALSNKKIVKINTSSIVSGCSLVGQLEDRVERMMSFFAEHSDIIPFIDEIHTSIGAGSGGHSSLDLANMLKPYIDRGQIKLITATTVKEYDKHMKDDGAFNRRFIKMEINEPSDEILYQILNSVIGRLSLETGVKWNFDEVSTDVIIKGIIKATNKSHRQYDDPKYNPDLSIGILANAFARALKKDNDFVSITDIADAINNCYYLYKSTRSKVAKDFVSTYKLVFESDVPQDKPRIIKFVPKNYTTIQ